MYASDSESEDEPRELNKKLARKPPKRMVVIKNPDKIGH